ncbi:methyltransferase domain-containing protein [bacterium]|nr:methyltransferase domain-containing protein [bacterium]
MIRVTENIVNRSQLLDTHCGSRLHLGCGTNVVDAWINLDGSLGVLISNVPSLHQILRRPIGNPPFFRSKLSPKIKFHDVRSPLPFANESISAIYCSPMLEHLYRNEQERRIKECYRVLRPWGVVRILVPDLAYMIN